jgi:hypothetical protein
MSIKQEKKNGFLKLHNMVPKTSMIRPLLKTFVRLKIGIF